MKCNSFLLEQLKITLINETMDQVAGYAEIPLMELALNEGIQGTYNVLV